MMYQQIYQGSHKHKNTHARTHTYISLLTNYTYHAAHSVFISSRYIILLVFQQDRQTCS